MFIKTSLIYVQLWYMYKNNTNWTNSGDKHNKRRPVQRFIDVR